MKNMTEQIIEQQFLHLSNESCETVTQLSDDFEKEMLQAAILYNITMPSKTPYGYENRDEMTFFMSIFYN